MKKNALLLCLALILSACSIKPPPSSPATATAIPSTATTVATAAPLPTATATPLPAPTATLDPSTLPAPRYTISATLDYANHSLAVLEQILYTNRSSEAIPELLLVADAQVFPGAFNLKEIHSSSGPALGETTWEKTFLHASLAQPLQPGESVQLEASFDLALPARTADPSLRPMVFGWSARQTNLVDWYLYIPPYQAGSGWLAHSPGYYGEHQVYEDSDFTVNLQTNNAPASLTAAASAPEQIDSGWRSYVLKQARTFAISLSPDYKVSTQTVGSVTLTGYYFSFHAAAGEAALKAAADSVALYSRLFGAYPHSSLAVVEADFLDGMEYDGLFFLSNGFYNLYHGTPGEYLVALAAHETAHQWWFGMVGSDQAMEPWLDEALSTYSERIYYENVAPDALNWWWEVRVKYYKPRGFVDDSIYNPHHEASAYRAYRDAVYLNGALFLEDLRKQVGDEAFFSFLKNYAARYAGKTATSQDFFKTLREHTQADLSGLIQTYFSTPR